MRKLVTEISTLKTSLPSGIFIRYAASRLDTMKILIISSCGTPYEHGFFEFDLFCPLEYPRVAPRMQFRTTAGVCLSLLGTWSGEPWRPGQSTILQLLVSIQSMILCENPWYNEPGRENRVQRTESNNYNIQARDWTLQHAIKPWLSKLSANEIPDPILTGLWGNVVHFHLRHHAAEIKQSHTEAHLYRTNASLTTAVRAVNGALKMKGFLD
ncbi:UBC-like protein [Xylariaceae sp. AK1471]|nr:UBC-like protein [Xylariaceae sp. AK1471]